MCKCACLSVRELSCLAVCSCFFFRVSVCPSE